MSVRQFITTKGRSSTTIGRQSSRADQQEAQCGHLAIVDTFPSVDTSLLWTLFVWPLAVHISEVLLYYDGYAFIKVAVPNI